MVVGATATLPLTHILESGLNGGFDSIPPHIKDIERADAVSMNNATRVTYLGYEGNRSAEDSLLNMDSVYLVLTFGGDAFQLFDNTLEKFHIG